MTVFGILRQMVVGVLVFAVCAVLLGIPLAVLLAATPASAAAQYVFAAFVLFPAGVAGVLAGITQA